MIKKDAEMGPHLKFANHSIFKGLKYCVSEMIISFTLIKKMIFKSVHLWLKRNTYRKG